MTASIEERTKSNRPADDVRSSAISSTAQTAALISLFTLVLAVSAKASASGRMDTST